MITALTIATIIIHLCLPSYLLVPYDIKVHRIIPYEFKLHCIILIYTVLPRRRSYDPPGHPVMGRFTEEASEDISVGWRTAWLREGTVERCDQPCA